MAIWAESSISSANFERLSSLNCFHDQPRHKPVQIITVRTTSLESDACRTEVRDIHNVDDAQNLDGLSSTDGSGDYLARIICITQNHSFRPLNVNASTIKTIMQEHNIREEFLDLVSSFYQKIVKVEQGLSLPFQLFESGSCIEYMYVFRYAEETHREEDPWTIRQTALYHQIRRTDQRSTYVLISPYPDTTAQIKLTEWLCSQRSAADCKRQTLIANSLLLSSYLDNCRYYMSFHDSKLETLFLQILAFGLENIDGVSASDMVHLKFSEARLFPIDSALAAVESILNGLERVSQLFSAQSMDRYDPSSKRAWAEVLMNNRNKVSAYRNNLQVLLQRCNTVSQLLDGVLNFNRQRIAQKQAADVLYLTESTVRDSATVRVITTITLVFLSFTGVAAIMAMPVFYLHHGTHTLSVSRSIWIYVTIAVTLTTITMVYWRWELRRQPFRRRLQSSHDV